MIQSDRSCAAAAGKGGSDSTNDPAHVDHTSFVDDGPATACGTTSDIAERLPGTTSGSACTSSAAKTDTGSHAVVGQAMQAAGLLPQVAFIIEQSWRAGTKAQYKTYLEKWQNFCIREKIDMFSAPVNMILEFLAQLYNTTWDVDIVLRYIKSLSPVKSISLKQLSHKLVMLLLLLSGQRCQTIHLLDTRNMNLTPGGATFTIGDLLKTTRPGYHPPPLEFLAYAPDRRLCVHTVLTEYLRRTLDLRGKERKLLISFRKPHKAISRDTLRRWIRDTMEASGIDTGTFKPHSVRAASVNSALQNKLPLRTIMKAAGWRTESTFATYYHKPIAENYGEHVFK